MGSKTLTLARTAPAVRPTHGGLWLVAASCAAWVTIVSLVYLWSISVDSRPGDPASAPQTWPQDAALAMAEAGPTMVMFLHSECPCSAASVDELAKVLETSPVKPRLHVVMVWYDTMSEVQNSPLLVRASQLPGALVTIDHRAVLARRFGSRTSGDVLIFDAAGQLRFVGGVTSARGHVGPNRSQELALAALGGELTERVEMPVFGCPLY